MSRRLSLLLVPLILAAIVTVAVGLTRSVSVPAQVPLALPDTLGIWTLVENVTFEKRVIDILATRDVTGKIYRDPDGRQIEIIVVRAVNNRSAFHPPEYCMIGTGSELVNKQVRDISVPDGRMTYNEMLLAPAAQRRMLVANWYYAGEHRTENFYAQQWRIVVDQVIRGFGAGAVVNVYANVDGQDQDAAATRKASQDFIAAVLPYVRAIP